MTATMTATMAALFDWDGVIVDSSELHCKSWELLAEEEKRILPPDHFKKSFGMKNEQVIPQVLQWEVTAERLRYLSLRKEELYRQLVKEQGVKTIPGTPDFIRRLHDHGVPMVIASSTHLKNIETVLEVLGFRHFFAGIVSAEDVKEGKPHPDVFLKAAQKAAVPASACIVFEDAPVGIEAALNAGMKVIALTTSHSATTLKNATKILPSLGTLSIDTLNGILKG